MTILVRPAQLVKPTCSVALQPRRPLPGILKLGQAGVGVLPEGEEFLTMPYGFGVPTFFLKYCMQLLKAP